MGTYHPSLSLSKLSVFDLSL